MNTQNYPTWLVPIEIAEKLKEIGFDKECQFFLIEDLEDDFYPEEDEKYSFNDVIFVFGDTYDPDSIGDPSLSEIEIFNYNSLKHKVGQSELNYLSIPTWTELFAWFRERGLHGYINYYSNSFMDEGTYYCYEITDGNDIQQYYCDSLDSYEEAQESLVLSLIKIYKEKHKLNPITL